MISTEAASPAATTKALSSFSSSLPPPYAFEDLYSSYQNEWDQPETSNPEDTKNDIDNDDDFDITKGVSNLQWITIPNESNNKNDTFLLACTDAGEIVTWKLVGKEQDKAMNNNDNSRLEPHSRVTISNNNGAVAEETTTNDEKKDSIDDERLTFSSLNDLCIVTVDDGNATSQESTTARKTKHTKKRPRKETNTNDSSSNALVQNRVVLVAGSDGLWCIPLLDVLQEKPSINSNDSQQQQQSNYKPLPSSLVQLSDRPIRTVTSYTTSSNENKDDSSSCCFVLALEEQTNNLCQWNLSTILKNNRCSVVEVVANDTTIIAATPTTKDWKTDLSQIFSNSSGTIKNKSKTKIANRRDDNNNERATTMLVVKNANAKTDETNSNSNGFQLLVGTDRSRLWILDEESIRKKTHRGVLSLHDKRSSTQNNNTTASLKNNSSVVWTVTDIVETKGAWWTVSATTKTTSATRNKNNSSNATAATGLLVTWHAPTGMVMAREETREAIQAISQTHDKQKLYSAANESAIAVWESSFSLRRQGRFWASPPAIRTLAICCDNDSSSLPKKNLLAVAGVGNKVDIFLDQCRVETLRI